MYALKHYNGYTDCYFSRFGPWGAEYVTCKKPEQARRFESKTEAALFAKQMLKGNHTIIKI